MNKKLIRWLGVAFLFDGLLTLLLGRSYLRLFRFGQRRNPFHRLIEFLLDLPNWQLRGAGAVEAGLGLFLLNRAPLEVPVLYRQIASQYALIDPGWHEWVYPQAHQDFGRMVAASLAPGGTVLDLGCGTGANLARIRALNLPYRAYTGVDISDAMLRYARERYENLPKVRFQQLDLLAGPLPQGPYDLVISTWVFEHLPDPVLGAQKAWDQLKPGGRMALLFETRGTSLADHMTGLIYPFLSVRRIKENEYRRFPGRVMVERHYPGFLGDLVLLVLGKPGPGS